MTTSTFATTKRQTMQQFIQDIGIGQAVIREENNGKSKDPDKGAKRINLETQTKLEKLADTTGRRG